jgi:hypothetical protein
MRHVGKVLLEICEARCCGNCVFKGDMADFSPWSFECGKGQKTKSTNECGLFKKQE